MKAEALFEEIHNRLRGEPRGEWFDADCPLCGKEAKRGQVHFSYNEAGFNCFVCGNKGGLRALADRLNIAGASGYEAAPAPRPAPAPKPLARWRENPGRLLAGYREAPGLVAAWQRYKPLTPQTLDRFGFGYGRLPFIDKRTGEWYMGPHNRLIVPLWHEGQLAGLKGRAIEPDDLGAKWICATGSDLKPFGLDLVEAGRVVFVCENYVDAAWLMQERPDTVAIGLGSVSAWRYEYTFALARAHPRLVVIAFDNDLPGQAQGAMRAALEAEWRADAKHAGLQAPASNGAKLLRELQGAGLDAALYKWPDTAPAKADIGWLLAQGRH
jgi:hypothetical protein